VFNQLLTELKNSVRLRIGLALVVAVLWFNGILSLRDQLAADQKRVAQLAGQIHRARQYATQTEWPERAKQARITQVELEGRLWHSGTPGLAQAAFQDWLTQSLKRAAMGRSEITLIQDAGNSKSDESLWKIKARLSFDFSPGSFHDWLSQVTGNERQISVEKLNVRTEPVPRVEAILVAPFQKNN
jgi:hypothetical protein